MTDRLADIEARCEEVQRGIWGNPNRAEALARTDIPYLIARIRQLEADSCCVANATLRSSKEESDADAG